MDCNPNEIYLEKMHLTYYHSNNLQNKGSTITNFKGCNCVKILVVDDDSFNLKAMECMMEIVG